MKTKLHFLAICAATAQLSAAQPGHRFACADYSAGKVFVVDAAGKVEFEFKTKSCNDLWVLPNWNLLFNTGHTLISCGDRPGGKRVFEVDAAGKVVWEVGEKDLAGIDLKFVAGIQRLPNGNTVLCNWQGHGAFGSGPHLIEVIPEKNVVWTFADHKTMRTIASVQLLDVPGDATRGEIQH